MPVFGYVHKIFPRVGIISHSSARHIYVAVLAVLSVRAIFGTVSAIPCKNVAFIAKMNKSPKVAVAAKVNVSAASAIAAIGTAFGLILCPVKVNGTCSAFSGTAIYFGVVYEIAVGQSVVLCA